MKTMMLISFCLSLVIGKAQNFSVFSDSKVIMLTLAFTPTPEKAMKMFGVEVREVRITGTERSVMKYYYANKSLWAECDCNLLSASQCIGDLRSRGLVTENIPNYAQLNTVKVEYPDPGDFNNVFNASRQSAEQPCEPNACVTFCSDQICASVGCGSEVEMCYSGNFSVSASNGQFVVEAKVE